MYSTLQMLLVSQSVGGIAGTIKNKLYSSNPLMSQEKTASFFEIKTISTFWSDLCG